MGYILIICAVLAIFSLFFFIRNRNKGQRPANVRIVHFVLICCACLALLSGCIWYFLPYQVTVPEEFWITIKQDDTICSFTSQDEGRSDEAEAFKAMVEEITLQRKPGFLSAQAYEASIAAEDVLVFSINDLSHESSGKDLGNFVLVLSDPGLSGYFPVSQPFPGIMSKSSFSISEAQFDALAALCQQYLDSTLCVNLTPRAPSQGGCRVKRGWGLSQVCNFIVVR